MQVTVTELASLVQGRTHGPADRAIRAARPLREAGPDDISFLENERNVKHLKSCRAAALVVPPELASRAADLAGPDGHTFALVEAADPLSAFVNIFRHLDGQPPAPPAGIDPRAAIDPTAKLGPGCTVMPFAVVGPGTVIGARCVLYPGAVVGASCRLGDEVVLHPQAVLYDRTTLGDRVIIHANAVVGADGFGYRFAGGRHVKVPHLGSVEIGDDVEVGACATIDRGTFQPTRIGAGTKIDNLVQVAHNCRIGPHNLLCSQSGIAGSCETGGYVVLAGGAGIADHVAIGDRAVIGARSGVPSDVAAGQRLAGYPARPERETLRIWASTAQLPEMVREFRQMKQQLAALTGQADQERKAG